MVMIQGYLSTYPQYVFHNQGGEGGIFEPSYTEIIASQLGGTTSTNGPSGIITVNDTTIVTGEVKVLVQLHSVVGMYQIIFRNILLYWKNYKIMKAFAAVASTVLLLFDVVL